MKVILRMSTRGSEYTLPITIYDPGGSGLASVVTRQPYECVLRDKARRTGQHIQRMARSKKQETDPHPVQPNSGVARRLKIRKIRAS
jgi:hypothetical protein